MSHFLHFPRGDEVVVVVVGLAWTLSEQPQKSQSSLDADFNYSVHSQFVQAPNVALPTRFS